MQYLVVEFTLVTFGFMKCQFPVLVSSQGMSVRVTTY